jgi:drug/metabolite transporter (DMT)-like permease
LPPAPARRTQILVVVLASLAFATSSPLARIAGELPPVAVAAGRTALASLLLGLSQPRALLGAYRTLTLRSGFGLFAAGSLLAAHFALFLGGLATTSFAATVALISLEPLAVVLVAWAAFGIAPKRAEWIGILLATLGAFVVSRGAGVGEHTLRGDLMVVAAVALYGAYVAVARGLRESMPTIPYATAVYAISALVLAPFVWPAVRDIAAPSVTAWVALVLLAVIPTVIGHTLVQVAARTAPPTIVALISPGETVGSLAIGAILLRRWPTSIEGAGTALILAGAVVAVHGAARGFDSGETAVVSPE